MGACRKCARTGGSDWSVRYLKFEGVNFDELEIPDNFICRGKLTLKNCTGLDSLLESSIFRGDDVDDHSSSDDGSRSSDSGEDDDEEEEEEEDEPEGAQGPQEDDKAPADGSADKESAVDKEGGERTSKKRESKKKQSKVKLTFDRLRLIECDITSLDFLVGMPWATGKRLSIKQCAQLQTCFTTSAHELPFRKVKLKNCATVRNVAEQDFAVKERSAWQVVGCDSFEFFTPENMKLAKGTVVELNACPALKFVAKTITGASETVIEVNRCALDMLAEEMIVSMVRVYYFREENLEEDPADRALKALVPGRLEADSLIISDVPFSGEGSHVAQTLKVSRLLEVRRVTGLDRIVADGMQSPESLELDVIKFAPRPSLLESLGLDLESLRDLTLIDVEGCEGTLFDADTSVSLDSLRLCNVSGLEVLGENLATSSSLEIGECADLASVQIRFGKNSTAVRNCPKIKVLHLSETATETRVEGCASLTEISFGCQADEVKRSSRRSSSKRSSTRSKRSSERSSKRSSAASVDESKDRDDGGIPPEEETGNDDDDDSVSFRQLDTVVVRNCEVLGSVEFARKLKILVLELAALPKCTFVGAVDVCNRTEVQDVPELAMFLFLCGTEVHLRGKINLSLIMETCFFSFERCTSMRISSIPDMKSLPLEVGKLEKLNSLKLEHMDDLTELPLSLPGNVMDVTMSRCPSVKALPSSWSGDTMKNVSLRLDDCKGIETLSELHVKQLTASGPSLKRVDRSVKVGEVQEEAEMNGERVVHSVSGGNVTLSECRGLEDFEMETVLGNLHLNGTGIVELHPIRVFGKLNLDDCPKLRVVHEGTLVGQQIFSESGVQIRGGDVTADNCPELESFKIRRVFGNLRVSRCPRLAALNDTELVVGLDVDELSKYLTKEQVADAVEESTTGKADLRFSKSLSSLPPKVIAESSLRLAHCPSLRSLAGCSVSVGSPQSLKKAADNETPMSYWYNWQGNGILDLRGCTNLETLGDSMQVFGSLILSCNMVMTSLPANLRVAMSLVLCDMTALTKIPSSISVGMNLVLWHCDALKRVSRIQVWDLPDKVWEPISSEKKGFSLQVVKCPKLTQLPSRWKIRAFGVFDCPIRFLPVGLVANSYAIGKCDDLGIPEEFLLALRRRLLDSREAREREEKKKASNAAARSVAKTGSALRKLFCAALPMRRGRQRGASKRRSSSSSSVGGDSGARSADGTDEEVRTTADEVFLGTLTHSQALVDTIALVMGGEAVGSGERVKELFVKHGADGEEDEDLTELFSRFRIKEVRNIKDLDFANEPFPLKIRDPLRRADETEMDEEDEMRYNINTGDLEREIYGEDFGSFYPSFSTWAEIAEFFGKLAGEEVSEEWTQALDITSLLTDDLDASSLMSYFSSLFDTADYEDPRLRRNLAQRVIDVLQLIKDDEANRDTIVQILVDATETCADRVLLGLNRVGVMLEVSRAKASPDPALAMRDLGRRMLYLRLIDDFIAEKAQEATNGDIDEIEMMLHLQNVFREELDLPAVSSRQMLYMSSSELTNHDIFRFRLRTVEVTEEEVQDFLDHWEPWLEMERQRDAKSLRWSRLPQGDRRVSLGRTDVFGDELTDAVELDGNVWSLSDLARHWAHTGADLNNTPRRFSQLRRKLHRCRNEQ